MPKLGPSAGVHILQKCCNFCMYITTISEGAFTFKFESTGFVISSVFN